MKIVLHQGLKHQDNVIETEKDDQQQTHLKSNNWNANNEKNIKKSLGLIIYKYRIIIMIAALIFLFIMFISLQLFQKKLDSGFENKQQEYNAFDDQVVRYYQQIEKQQQGKQIASDNLNKQLMQTLRQTRYYDIHYFVQDFYTEEPAKVIYTSKPNFQHQIQQKRQLLQILLSPQQIQLLINQMMYPPNRPAKMPNWQTFLEKTPQQIDTIYYYNQMSQNPSRLDYYETQFYRLDKLYKIGKYSKQLPLCVVLVGKNTASVVQKCYDSILRQNYTNYRVVHIDDNSYDGTIQKVIDYLKDKPFLKDRLTLISQRYQRNALFNRNFGILQYCKEEDIIVDIDADDWIIGKQVFQLVNSLYQAGNFQNGKVQDLWLVYTANVGYVKDCCPYATVAGQIPKQKLKNHLYRYEGLWRTTQLRTYLRKLYLKIDKTDMIDPIMIKQGQFYVQAYDTYMNYGMSEMSGYQHMRIVDQFNYFYTGSPPRGKHIEAFYCQRNIQTMRGYEKLRSLNDQMKRMSSYTPDQNKVKEYQKRKVEVKQLLQKLKVKVLEMYQKNKMKMSIIQKRKVYRKMYQDKKFGRLEYLGTNLSKLQPRNIKPGFFYQIYDFSKMILVGSSYDYINVSHYVNLNVLEKRLFKSVAHQVWSFNFNQTLESSNSFKLRGSIPTQQDLNKYIKQRKDHQGKSNQKQKTEGANPNSVQFLLSSHLASNLKNKTEQDRLNSLQYYYANQKYNIARDIKQVAFCILAYGDSKLALEKYQLFFQSLSSLNYSNFQIVYIDNNSPNDSAFEIYNYLKNSTMKIKNKIKIVKSLQNLSQLASIHIWGKNYCHQDDIVAIVRKQDRFLGSQVLKILNSVYEDPNVWLTYSRLIAPGQTKNRFYQIPIKIIEKVNQNIRSLQNSEAQFITFRKKVLDAVPIQHFIDYDFDSGTGMGFPRYYETANKILIKSLAQVSGKQRTKFLSDFFMLNNPQHHEKCKKISQGVEQLRYRLKLAAKKINKLGQQSTLDEEDKADSKLLQELLKLRQSLNNCSQKQKNKIVNGKK